MHKDPLLEEYYDSLVEAREVTETFLAFLLANQLDADTLPEFSTYEQRRNRSLLRVTEAKEAYFNGRKPKIVEIPAEIASKVRNYHENN